MTVPTLARALAQLMRITSTVSMYVAPVWAPLDHLGYIVDRFLPGTDTPCPYLQPGTFLRVFPNDLDASGGIWSLASRSRLACFPDFSSSSDPPVHIRLPLRNGEGGASMTGSEFALSDANTLTTVEQIALYNATPQAVLGGNSPRDLVYGPNEFSSNLRLGEQFGVSPRSDWISRSPGGSSTVQIEELQGLSSCDDPPLKRFRPEGHPGNSSPSRESDYSPSPDSSPELPVEFTLVSRWERSVLLAKFKKEQRLARKRFKLTVRGTWSVDLAEDKENDTKEVDPEVEAEAFEDYLFDRLMTHDGDAAFQLVTFRSTLRVVPDQSGGPILDPTLVRSRADNLWEGLRRVYFGEREREQTELGPELSHQQVMENLRKEITELEERLGRGQFPKDSRRPPYRFIDGRRMKMTISLPRLRWDIPMWPQRAGVVSWSLFPRCRRLLPPQKWRSMVV